MSGYRGPVIWGCCILTLALVSLLAIPACSQPGESMKEKENMLKVPYEPAAKDCFARLKKCNKVYRDGFDGMLSAANSSGTFRERLDRIFKIYGPTMTRGTEQPSTYTWSEEDAFLCCTFDLMKAMFNAEMSGILSEKSSGAKSKQEKLNDLVNTLEVVPLAGPKWNQIVMPAIKAKLQEAAKSFTE